MKIGIKREGGFGYFPGLNKTVTIDTRSLSDPAERQKLEHLIGQAEVPRHAQATASGQTAPEKAAGADQQHYVITLERGETRHTARVSAPIDDPHLAALVEHLQRCGTSESSADADPPETTTGKK